MTEQETWLNSKWRPSMGWMYMIVCITDFIIFPVLWNLLQHTAGQQITQWKPLTLEGAGLFHMAMGAVLGIAVWSRGKEKLAGVAGNYSEDKQG
jgi:hypothetical protein